MKIGIIPDINLFFAAVEGATKSRAPLKNLWMNGNMQLFPPVAMPGPVQVGCDGGERFDRSVVFDDDDD